MNIYVSNLSYGVADSDLLDLFSRFGEVTSAKVITDRQTGRSRGFGFVEMPNDNEAQQAINELNQQEFDGRAINVNEAKPKEDKPRSNDRGGFNRDSGSQRRFGSKKY